MTSYSPRNPRKLHSAGKMLFRTLAGGMAGPSDHDFASEPDWSRLMAAAQDGDQVAYHQLLYQILPFIRAIAARQHRAPDRIEDVVQEVLLTIHRVRHTYDPSRPFEA